MYQCNKLREMTTLSRIIDYERMQKITSEFSRLKDRCYLENAGASLYPESLIQNITKDLLSNVYMNPHTDKYTKDCIEQIRCLILKHFNTDPSNYTVIFTSGATQALKLVVESFQFTSDDDEDECGSFIYLQDNHTSVVGLRELAGDKNADIIHISHEDFLQSISSHKLTSMPENVTKNETNTLVAYPAENNFNGYKYPINCLPEIKDGCLNSFIKKNLGKINCNWYVLLDAAAYVPTNKLDLSKTQPDFVCLSFYKLFGYPTGLGALLVKNSSSDVLNQKRYFGGGTVDVVLSSEDFHVKRQDLHERFEDGTVSYLAILALKHCFDSMHRLIPKIINNDLMDTISYHTFYLAKDLYQQLNDLQHPNGTKAAILYMDSDFSDMRKQGSIVTFSLKRDDGTHIGYTEFQHMADLFNINVRTGCFCNSGSCQRHLKVSNKEMKQMYKAGHKCGDEVDLVDDMPTGAVRASFAYYNTFNDVDKLMIMITRCFVKTNLRKPVRITNYYTSNSTPTNGLIHDDTLKVLNEQNLLNSVENVSLDNHTFESKIVLKEIVIFPIKSCGAFKVLSDWKIGEKGFEYDREWMVIRDNGICLTQKQNTRMCLVKPVIDLKLRRLILNCKGKSSISIPLDPSPHTKFKEATICQSKICSDTVKGEDCGDEVADWISEALEVSFLRLIRQSDNRMQKKKIEPKMLSLSNQAQFLLINKATVRWLKDKIGDPNFTDNIDQLTDRFRGNLVVDMDEELAERDWQRLIIGRHEFKTEGLCPRCQMVCIDQRTGEKTVEPLRTIAEQFGGKLRFGIYLTYVGSVDGSKNNILKLHSPIKPIIKDEEINR